MFGALVVGPPTMLKSQEHIPRPTQRVNIELQTKDELYRELPNPQHDDFIGELPVDLGQFQNYNYIHGPEEFQKPLNQQPISSSPRKFFSIFDIVVFNS